jgi:hypothetical protein
VMVGAYAAVCDSCPMQLSWEHAPDLTVSIDCHEKKCPPQNNMTSSSRKKLKQPLPLSILTDLNFYFVLLQADEYIQYLCSPTGYVGMMEKKVLWWGSNPQP